MSDQGISEEITPGVAGPAGTGEAEPTQAEIDWQKRYSDLQPEYTRATQRAAELERQTELYSLLVSTEDPDTRRQVAEQLGYQLAEEELDPAAYEDPFEAQNARLERLEQQLSAKEQAEADAAYASEVRRHCDEQLDQLGLDKADQDWVLAYAINALPVNDQGLPDIAQAHQAFTARETERQRAWAQTKRQAPRLSPDGQAATEVPNLDNRQERVDWMVRRSQELGSN